MGQASVRSLLHTINRPCHASGRLRLQCMEKISDRLLEWLRSGQYSPHDLHQWSGMCVVCPLMTCVSSLGATHRAPVDCYNDVGAIWTTDHHGGKPQRGANEGMERLLLGTGIDLTSHSNRVTTENVSKCS